MPGRRDSKVAWGVVINRNDGWIARVVERGGWVGVYGLGRGEEKLIVDRSVDHVWRVWVKRALVA